MEINGRLVTRLAKLVDDDAGDWQPSDVPGQFRLALKAGSLKVHLESSAEDETPDVIFSIYNDKGRLVDQFSDRDLNRALSKPNNIDTWYFLCRRVFDHSRRKAMRAEQVVRKIIDELDDDIPF